jgi:hypothetical protein
MDRAHIMTDYGIGHHVCVKQIEESELRAYFIGGNISTLAIGIVGRRDSVNPSSYSMAVN